MSKCESRGSRDCHLKIKYFHHQPTIYCICELSSLIQKTLAFGSGAAVVYLGYVYSSEKLLINQQRVIAHIRDIAQNEDNKQQIVVLPTNIDHYEETSNFLVRSWNHSILYIHGVMSNILTSDVSTTDYIMNKYNQMKSANISKETSVVKDKATNYMDSIKQSMKPISKYLSKDKKESKENN
ncbi:hypothetical protein WA158_006375 [Blastocystis sp. Blastoise]